MQCITSDSLASPGKINQNFHQNSIKENLEIFLEFNCCTLQHLDTPHIPLQLSHQVFAEREGRKGSSDCSELSLTSPDHWPILGRRGAVQSS